MRKALLFLACLPLMAPASPAFGQRTAPAAEQCSPDALPPAEREAMKREYARRISSDGRESADAWLGREARAFRARLVARGICPPPGENDTQIAAQTQDPAPTGKDGKPCRTTRLENRNVANLGGGAMSMILVPVCAD